MITYTVRDATDHPLKRFADLTAAITAVDAECHAHTYDPSALPGSRIHRIVTADLDADDVGDVLYGRIERIGDRADQNSTGRENHFVLLHRCGCADAAVPYSR